MRITYRVDELTALLGIGRTKIYQLIADGDLRKVKLGATTLILAEDVHALLNARLV